jgi:polyadenylate-binding protein
MPPQQQARGRANFKYASNVRNAPETPQLDLSTFAALTPEYQKNFLGENLFPLVLRFNPELAAKITGMLLEMDNSEILHLLEDHEALKGKVNEAVEALNEDAE